MVCFFAEQWRHYMEQQDTTLYSLIYIKVIYIPCSMVVQEVVWLQRLFKYLDIDVDTSNLMMIFCDSIVVLIYAKDLKYRGRTKHIDRKYHYIKDMVA